MKRLKELIQGIMFGSSCLIPGFSGGTMLVILGIYEKITYELSRFLIHPFKVIKNLFYYFIGTIIGIIVSAILVSKALNNYPLITGCFFVGLVIGTIPIILKNLNVKKMNIIDIVFYFIFLSFGLYLTFFSNSINNINISNSIDLQEGIYILLTSIIASAVMIIPAASGMTILLIMGLYDDIMHLIELVVINLIILNFEPILNNIVFIILFGIGVILGVVIISKIITHVLNKKPSIIWSSVLGLLVVSILSIYNDVFTNRLDIILKTNLTFNIIFSIIALIVGIFIIFITNKILYKFNKK